MNLQEKAKCIAGSYHAGQKRRDGTDYIHHPIAVGDSFHDPELIAAGYLHDVLDDTACTAEILAQEGMTARTVLAVLAVTRIKGESYKNFIMRVGDSGEDAIRVKLADLKHNLSNLGNGSMRDKYELAQVILRNSIKDKPHE